MFNLLKRKRRQPQAASVPKPDTNAPSLLQVDHSQPDIPSALGIPKERLDELEIAFNHTIRESFDEAKMRGEDGVNSLELLDRVCSLARTNGELAFLAYNLDAAVEAKINPYIRAARMLEAQQEGGN